MTTVVITERATKKSWVVLWRDWLLLPLALLVLAVDQGSKYLLVHRLAVEETLQLPGPIELTHITNTGTAFGLFHNQTFVLTIASFVAIGILLLFYGSQARHSAWIRLSLGLQLGGALGNLIDRLVRGYVVDFIHITVELPVIGTWPVFNPADSAIVIGLGILMWVFFIQLSGHQPVKWPGPPAEYRPDVTADPGC